MPVSLGNVIVLSAVGSVTVSVVSKSSAVAPSKIMLLSIVTVVKLPAVEPPVTSDKNAKVPEPSCSVMVLSAVGSCTVRFVSYASAVEPSN